MSQVDKYPKKPITCVCDLQAGRFRKKKAMDCGKTMCAICHSDKLFGHEETFQEARSRVKLREQIAEL